MKFFLFIFLVPLALLAIDGEAGPGKNREQCEADCEENRSVTASDLGACKRRCAELPISVEPSSDVNSPDATSEEKKEEEN